MDGRTRDAFSWRPFAVTLACSVLFAACSATGAATGSPTAAAIATAASSAPAASPPSVAATPIGTSSTGRYGHHSATPAPATSGNIVVKVAMTAAGDVLAGPSGLTLYTKAGDSASVSTCTGGCATAWPPLTVASGSKATGGAGVTGTFGTLTRADGSLQVTYKGKPLYYWQGDSNPGDVTGNGVGGFSVARP
jgi:predicted lipoprotein with Yx(FWY)xxD motif